MEHTSQRKTQRGRRGKPYRVHWHHGEPTHVTAAFFQRGLDDGFLVLLAERDGSTSKRRAGLAAGVRAQVDGDAVVLQKLQTGETVRIFTSWIAIDRIAPPRGAYYEREIRRQYCGPRVVVTEPPGTWLDRCDWPRALAR